jgi:anaerobic sulfite reductase subunit B
MTMSQTPASYRVSSRRTETHDTVTLTLAPDGPLVPEFRPGQFAMLYAFGIGEIPVSVSGLAPSACLTHTIRAVGAVSRALWGARLGQAVGVRGPYGTSWRESDARGQDLLLIGGGIGLAPLRPAVLAALGERDRYRRVTVLVGARSPAELVYAAEIDQWREAGAAVEVTVDRADASWRGHVGVVTQLIRAADLDPNRTLALLCGPELMMRLTARSLLTSGMSPGRIRVSLERNMQCGVAECGHCQLGPLLLCRDGPVVSYQTAGPLLSIKEL